MRFCVLFFITALLSCTSEKYTYQEYLRFVNSPESGMVKEVVSGNNMIRVKYMTPEMLVYQEVIKDPSISPEEHDSLLKVFSNSRTFLLSIDKESGEDLMTGTVSNLDQYKILSNEMNFNMDERILLRSGAGEYRPSLIALENSYGLHSSRTFIVVFSAVEKDQDLLTSEELDFIFEDDIFNSGINHFRYEKRDLDRKFIITNA